MSVNNLGKKRTKLGITIDQYRVNQGELSAASGVNRNTISKLCNQERSGAYEDTYIRIVSGLRKMGFDVSINDIL